MSNKLTGTVYSVGDTQVISDKFSKREIIILDESDKFPQHICIQFTQDKCNDLNDIASGQQVEISYNLQGRLWNNPKTGTEQCFNTLLGWKINVTGNVPSAAVSVDLPVSNDDYLPF